MTLDDKKNVASEPPDKRGEEEIKSVDLTVGDTRRSWNFKNLLMELRGFTDKDSVQRRCLN